MTFGTNDNCDNNSTYAASSTSHHQRQEQQNRSRAAEDGEEEAQQEEGEGDRYYHDEELNAGTGNGGKKQERFMWQHYYTHHPLRLLPQRRQHHDDVDEAEAEEDDDRANQASAGKGDDKSDEKCPKISMRTMSNNKDEIGVPYQHQEQQQQDDEEEQYEQQEEEISRRRIRPPRSIVIPSLANDSLKINEEESFDNLRSPSFHQRQEEEDLSITDESTTRIVPDRGKTKVVIYRTEEAQRTNKKAEVNADDRTSQDYILMDECSKYVSRVKMELLALDREEHFDRFLHVLGYWEEDELSWGEVLFEMRLILQDTSEEDLLDEFISFLPVDAHEAARLEIAAARLVKEEKIFQKERAN